jgi:hypothetical protein
MGFTGLIMREDAEEERESADRTRFIPPHADVPAAIEVKT